MPFSAIRQRDARITSAWAVHPSRAGVVRLWCVHVAASTKRVDNDGIQVRPGPRELNCRGALVRTADGDRIWQRIEPNMIPATTLDFPTATVGYAQDSGLGTFRTRDGGRDWSLVR